MSESFEKPVKIRSQDRVIDVVNAAQASLILADVDWPGERTPVHRDAYETCLKVMDGHRSASDGRKRFVEAAKEAGILVET